MAMEGGGKIKPKRQHQDTRPYARRQSLLGRVKDRVRGILSPSWVMDLVNGVKKPPPQGEHQDSYPLHNQADGVIPVRREMNCTSTNNDGINPGSTDPQAPTPATLQGPSGPSDHLPYTPTQMPYGYRPPPPPMPTLILTNGDDQSEVSEYSQSTSMCSSMVPQPDRKEYQGEVLQLTDSHLRQMQHHMELHTMSTSQNTSVSSASTSTVMENSFLWSNTKPRLSQPQPAAKSQKPSFNVSAFNSSIMSADTRGLGSGYRESSFYPGKTTFGGASSHRKSRLKATTPYEPSPARKQIKARPLKNTSLGGVTSSAAKKILDTLERMSTPLSDAKKIPFDGNLTDSMLSFTPGSYRRRRTLNTSLSQSMTEGPPTEKLNVSTYASIAVNRQPPASSASSSGSQLKHPEPRQGASSTVESSSTTATRPTEKPAQRSGKMKRDRGTHYSSKQEEEEMEVPDLPTGFTLPAVNFELPTIMFGVSSASGVKTIPAATSLASERKQPSNNHSDGPSFTFSSPIVKSSVSVGGETDSSHQKFQFSSPITISKDDAHKPELSQGVKFGMPASTASVPRMKPPKVNFALPAQPSFKPSCELKSGSVMDVLGKGPLGPASELKSGSVMDVLPRSKPTPNGSIGGLQPAASLKTGSVMDILGGSSSTAKPPSQGGSSTLFKKEIGSWVCTTCLVQNKPVATKCVACEALKPTDKLSMATPAPQSSSSGLTGLFKKSAGEWTCDTCLVQNKSENMKCLACETPKPKATHAGQSQQSSSIGLSAQFGKSQGQWTCDTCLIQNKSDAIKCVACESPKPKPKSSAPPPTQVAPGTGFGSLFKKQSGTWDCATCLIQNRPGTTKCIACETAKPADKSASMSATQSSNSGFASLKKPVDQWMCDTCLVSNKSEAAKCIACETPKPGAKPVQAQKPSGFGNIAKKASGSWDCDTCLVSNKAEATRCIACETPRPGVKPTTGFTSSGGFKFAPSGGFKFGATSSTGGSTNPSTTEIKKDLPTNTFKVDSTSGFSFGNTGDKKVAADSEKSVPKENAVKPAFGGFKFGQAAAEEKEKGNSKAPSVGGFQAALSHSSAVGTKNSEIKEAKSQGGFQFGLPAVKKIENSIKTATESSKGKTTPEGGLNFQAVSESNSLKPASGLNFQFGQPAGDSQKGEPHKPLGGGFQFSATGSDKNTAPANPVFQFSAKPVDSTTKEKDSLGGSLAFGMNKAEASKPIFGASTNTDVAKPTNSSGLFSFGVAAATAPGETNKAPASGGFTFNTSKPAETKPAAAAPTFVFGTSSTESKPNTSNFSFGASTTKVESQPAGGFNFKPSGPSSSATSPNKRGRDELEGGSAAKKGNFVFGSAPADNGGFKFGDAKPAASTGGTPSFSFGQSSTPAFGSNPATSTTTVGAFGGFTATPAAGNAFGTAAPGSGQVFGGNTASSTPAFGSTAPAFGAPTTTAAGGLNMTTPANFNFGGQPTQPAGGLFQFTASTQPAAATTAGGSSTFTFGQTAAPTQPAGPAQAQGPALSFSATPSFNFTGNAGTTQTPSFNFSASGPGAAANPFSTSGQGSTGPNRRIKKAVRKLRK